MVEAGAASLLLSLFHLAEVPEVGAFGGPGGPGGPGEVWVFCRLQLNQKSETNMLLEGVHIFGAEVKDSRVVLCFL